MFMETQESVKERIKTFCKASHIQIKEFESASGMSHGYVNAMRKGLGTDKLNNVLLAFPNLNREWLLYGEGNMTLSEPAKANSETLPYFDDFPASAGRVEQYPDILRHASHGSIDIPEAKGAEFVMPVIGCSMQPTIREGEIIGVAHIDQYETANADRVYLIITRDNERMIKRILGYDKESQQLTLASDNPAYPPFRLSVGMVVDIYKVVFHMVFETL